MGFTLKSKFFFQIGIELTVEVKGSILGAPAEFHSSDIWTENESGIPQNLQTL